MKKQRDISVYKPGGLMAYLLEAAKGPQGVHAPDVQGWPTARVSSSLWLLGSLGQVFKARLGHRKVHHFATAEAAQAFEAAHAHRYVAPQPLRPAVEMAEDRAALRGSARSMRGQAAAEKLRANAVALPAAERAPVVMTYGPTPTTGPLSGHCPPDRPLVLRAGALDFRRYMTKHQAHGMQQAL